jgi:hypothetical protein
MGDSVAMFLRCKSRKKDGKTHRYWSVVESCRTKQGKIVQRHVLIWARSTMPSAPPGARR